MEIDPSDRVHSTPTPSDLSWPEMFRSASTRSPQPRDPCPPQPDPNPNPPRPEDELQRLALYVAMAHAGLAFFLLLLYGLYHLLHDFLRPILWAVVCSIPLRDIQQALVSFWAESIAAGYIATLLAVPAAVYRVSAATAHDIRSLFRHRSLPTPRFPLLRWLSSLAVFVLIFEHLGGAVPSFILVVLVFAVRPPSGSLIPAAPASRRLKTLVAGGLIVGMLAGAAIGGAFFSYKIVVESKDAVFIAKSRFESSNYVYVIGFRRWMEENDVAGKVDKYTSMAYDAVLEQIDVLAAHYNLTDIAAELKHHVLRSCSASSSSNSTSLVACGQLPVTEKVRSMATRARNNDWKGMYDEMRLVFEEMQRSRADLAGKAKRVVQNMITGGRTVVGGGAWVTYSLVLAVVSGASELLKFASHLTVFVSVLYYLITGEGGGVTTRAAAMLPLSEAVRLRCVKVLDRAISNVILDTVKIAIFQGCLTWLLFWLCSVHFLYVSTMLAVASPLLPFLPRALSTVPAAGQLLLEGKYVGAAAVAMTHNALMGLGVSSIQKNNPGDEYLMGLSIIGGMALFPSTFEGAIMGPLIMTVVIACQGLYKEFVLLDSNAI